MVLVSLSLSPLSLAGQPDVLMKEPRERMTMEAPDIQSVSQSAGERVC